MTEQTDQSVLSPKTSAVMAELARNKNSKKNMLTSLLVLAITLSLFLGFNVLNSPIRDSIIILLVIFIHEMGHMVFMKLYKYKNLSMFFIPLFGAAVTGKVTNPDAKQKAIVSIMGPLPGIVLAIATGFLFLVTGNQALHQYAFISLLINGFNLLPIYPLDGGHFFDNILFSRSKNLEIVFKAGAVLLLFYISITFQDWMLIAFAVLISLSIPMTIQVAKISNQLKNDNDAAPLTFSDNIPAGFVDMVMMHIKNYRSKDSKTIARIVEGVWVKYFTRAPKILTSILFTAGYVFLMLVIILSLGLLSGIGETNKSNSDKFPIEQVQ
ncbi:MAG: hypothetical protein CVV44_17640 [Spirochaetae bacterium HGW-Spirochaetae-1]|jgi:Zn-dependent protease|nr:MAG: hypothetical protein CVV44_17640 [Spirochaetae bacterium HGW-Spirochaetae-1]